MAGRARHRAAQRGLVRPTRLDFALRSELCAKFWFVIAAANSQFRPTLEDIGANYPIDGQRGVPGAVSWAADADGRRQTVAAPFYVAAAPWSSPSRRVCVAGGGVF